MVDGFDETVTDEFIQFIRDFSIKSMPRIEEVLNRYPDKDIRVVRNYQDVERLVEKFENYKGDGANE
ncbi:MAG TPA: hypothetical protein DEP72_04030 [Clostridiales bacterium]|nr:MAG: hypothetical protein A2Y18_04305 [Clostridiales bacterium GWD2_32_19]HCC07314.1 hypothetical protein [Clostridiales bacterium]